MQQKFRFINTPKDLQKLREFEQKQEIRYTRNEGLRKLSQILRERVLDHFQKGKILHDIDVQLLALQINREHNLLEGFRASIRWVQKLKKASGFVSRKITTF